MHSTFPSHRASLQAALFGLVLLSCHHAPPLTPEQVDTIHLDCERRIGSGFVPHANRNVGFLPETVPAGTPVVLYGASWCSACRAAQIYFTRRSIPFVEKDVESDERAAAELNEVLARAGLAPTTALPVIDARGTVTIGFAPCTIEGALAAP